MNSAEGIFGNRTLIRPEFQSIIQNITEHNLEDETNIQIVTTLVVAIIISTILGSIIRHRIPWFPTVTIFLWVGYLLQMLLEYNYTNHQWKPTQLLHSSFFHILQYGILPFQMFRFGFQINSYLVVTQMKSVLLLSIGENILSIILFTFLWYTLLPIIGLPPFSIWNTLAFCASMISSDSSVTITFFKEQKCSQKLTTLMEMDTIFSEIIGLLLFRTIVEMQLGDFNSNMILEGIQYILTFLFNTFFIGMITGIASSILFKFIHVKSSSIQLGEVSLFVIVPITAYMWAQGLHVSSSIAVRICGVFMSQYTQYNLNEKTRQFIHKLVHLLGQIADSGAYMIFGMLSYMYNFFSIDIRWLLLGLSVSLLSRYTAVASILDWFFSSSTKKSVLNNNNQSYLLYFLCQGTVAFSIILRTQGEMLDTSNVEIMLKIVLYMINFSVIQIIIIANPMIQKQRRDSDIIRSDSQDGIELPTIEKSDISIDRKADMLFPYLVKIDTTTEL